MEESPFVDRGDRRERRLASRDGAQEFPEGNVRLAQPGRGDSIRMSSEGELDYPFLFV